MHIPLVTCCGSPPRAWGQWARWRGCVGRGRFTPTGVGTIYSPRVRAITKTVHPHGRGDNGDLLAPARADGGSPPRAWGQSARRGINKIIHRFTPTGVGTILIFLLSLSENSVHPHGRGDNFIRIRQPNRSAGSPPRAWGQSACRLPRSDIRRFTPTGVGTMGAMVDECGSRAVHPHGRGDN